MLWLNPDAAPGAPPLQELTDEALMLRYAERGDQAAFAALFQRYAPRLRGFFLRSVCSAVIADDLTQVTLLNVHRARRDYDPARAFRPWVFTIALNVRREHFRRAGRRNEVALEPGEPAAPSVSPEVSTPHDRLMRRAIGELREDQREVILLHWYEGFSFPEIGRMLGASTGAVKLRAHRAYNALRSALS